VNIYKEDLNLDGSRQTLKRTLIEFGYRAYAAPPKLPLTEVNIKARKLFARNHNDWGVEKWKRIIFTDESMFTAVNTSGQVLIKRLASEALTEGTVQDFNNFSKSI